MSPGGFVSLPPDAGAAALVVAHADALEVVEPRAVDEDAADERAVVVVGGTVARFVPDEQPATSAPRAAATAPTRSAGVIGTTVGRARFAFSVLEVRVRLE